MHQRHYKKLYTQQAFKLMQYKIAKHISCYCCSVIPKQEGQTRSTMQGQKGSWQVKFKHIPGRNELPNLKQMVWNIQANAVLKGLIFSLKISGEHLKKNDTRRNILTSVKYSSLSSASQCHQCQHKLLFCILLIKDRKKSTNVQRSLHETSAV
jgi:hypothetical protein